MLATYDRSVSMGIFSVLISGIFLRELV